MIPPLLRFSSHLLLSVTLGGWLTVVSTGCTDGTIPAAPASISETFWFQEVARASGIDFVHDSGPSGAYQLPEIMGSGCAWLDFDRDGNLDAYLIGAGPDPERARNRLYRGDGEGKFVDVTESSGAGGSGYGMGCAIGDYNLDGHPDIYVTNFGANTLYRNNRNGTFTDVTSAAGVGDPRWSASALFVDVDRDGDLDLFVTNYMKHPKNSRRPCFDGAGRIEYCGPRTHFPPERDTLYQNQGDGTFVDITRSAGMAESYGYGLGVVYADFSGDGNPDIYVANDATPNQLWIAEGEGRFTDRGVEWGAAYNLHGHSEAGMGVQAEDVDGDGHLDLFVTNLVNETNTFYHGQGAGRFDDTTFRTELAGPSLPKTGFGVGFFDADHDGDLDLLVTNGRIRRGPPEDGATLPASWGRYAERDQFFEHVDAEAPATESSGGEAGRKARKDIGPRGLQFKDRSESAGLSRLSPHLGRGLALGDYDNDGDVDALVTVCGGRAKLYRNQMPKRGRWLVVSAEHPGGGEVYGARVTVRAAGTTVEKHWTRLVQPGYSYLASNDPRLHFGLGEASKVDVEVEWPNGTKTEVRQVSVDQILEVKLMVKKVEGERKAP